MAPVAETVTVADRAEVPVLACAVTVTVPLLEPDVGLAVSQAWSSATLQPTLEMTLNVPELLAAAATLTALGETDNEDCAEQFVAGEPVPAGAEVDVVMLILSSRAPSSR